MSSTFGSRLRAHREQEQISLDDVAARTKIRLPLLEALERDDISQWPRGLGRRSYVRSYAHAVGLDPEATVREFLALYPDPVGQVDEPAAAATTTDSGPQSHRPRTSLHTFVQSVVGTFVRPRRPSDQTGVPASNELARQSTDGPASSSHLQIDANDRDPEVVHRSRTIAERGSEVVLLPVMQIDALDDEFLSEAEHPDLVQRHAPQAAAPPDSVREVADAASPSTDADSPAAEQAVPSSSVPDAASALQWRAADDDLMFHVPLEPLSEAHDLVADAPLSTTAGDDADDAAPDIVARDTAPVVDIAAAVPGRSLAFPIDLPRLSDLCSRIARARTATNVTALMPEIAAMLHADQVSYWVWDSKARVLWPSLSAGYDRELFRQLPRIPHDSENAVAVSFRSHEIRVIDGDEEGYGALAVPGLTPVGCAGVLALELSGGGERHPVLHALATVIAAELAGLEYVPPVSS